MGEPVISVDTQKKELVGDFENPGREWHPQGRPDPVRIHDFEIRQPETPVCDAIRAIGQWNTAWDPFYELPPLCTDEFFAFGASLYKRELSRPEQRRKRSWRSCNSVFRWACRSWR